MEPDPGSSTALPRAEVAAAEGHGAGLEMITGFSPWIAAFFITGAGRVRAGLVIAALLSAGLILHTLLVHRRPKLLDWSTLGVMVVFALVSFAVSDDVLGQWLSPLLNGALLVIMLGSVLSGHPFTLGYARDEAPPEVWDTS